MTTLSPRDLLVELIKTLGEDETSYNPGSGTGGPLLMPTLYREGSYSELESRLDEMRDSAQWRLPWWHVTQRYLAGVVATVDVSFRRTRQGPHPNLPGRCELVLVEGILGNQLMKIRVYRWDSRVEEGLVRAGLDRLLATMYGGQTERIQLPLEFLYRALGKELPHEHQPRASHLPSPSLLTA